MIFLTLNLIISQCTLMLKITDSIILLFYYSERKIFNVVHLHDGSNTWG